MKLNKHLLVAQLAPALVLFVIYLVVTGQLFTSIFFGLIAFIILVGAARITGTSYTNKQKAKYSFIAEESIFNNTILVLLAAIVKVDEKQSDMEFRYIEAALSEHFSQIRVIEMLKLIEKLVRSEKLNYQKVCRVVVMNFRLNERIQLLHFLVGIATADGILTKSERELVTEIAHKIGLTTTTVDSILNMFSFISEEELKYRQERNERKKTVIKMGLSQAYKILGLAETAGVTEIKKAYRKLAMQHHPDRLIHLGAEHQQSAKAKFQSISDAYEYIKEKKGFS